MVPCGIPSSTNRKCRTDESTDWIKGTSDNDNHSWAGYKTGPGAGTGKITDYMKDNEKDIVSADPASIMDARDRQCKDWITYYSGSDGGVVGKDNLSQLIKKPDIRSQCMNGGEKSPCLTESNKIKKQSNSGSAQLYIDEPGSIQPYFPGWCKPDSSCISVGRVKKGVENDSSPEAPGCDASGNCNIINPELRWKTFHDFINQYNQATPSSSTGSLQEELAKPPPADRASAIFKACRCEGGKFSPNGKLDKPCIQCPKGTYLTDGMADKGFTFCLDCPPGSYQDAEGEKTCKPCPNGTYQDKWGQTHCKSAPCGFKCPPEERSIGGDTTSPPQDDLSKQIPPNLGGVWGETGGNGKMVVGRKVPVACGIGEYCPGAYKLSGSTKESLAGSPHVYEEPQGGGSKSCKGCIVHNSPLHADSEEDSKYCKENGACTDCGCPKGHFCPDRKEELTYPDGLDIGPGTDETCDCPGSHEYSEEPSDPYPEITLGEETQTTLLGKGHETRCCKEGQCCDIAIDACTGSGRIDTKGFVWPVSSPEGYQSHCLPNGQGTVTQ